MMGDMSGKESGELRMPKLRIWRIRATHGSALLLLLQGRLHCCKLCDGIQLLRRRHSKLNSYGYVRVRFRCARWRGKLSLIATQSRFPITQPRGCKGRPLPCVHRWAPSSSSQQVFSPPLFLFRRANLSVPSISLHSKRWRRRRRI